MIGQLKTGSKDAEPVFLPHAPFGSRVRHWEKKNTYKELIIGVRAATENPSLGRWMFRAITFYPDLHFLNPSVTTDASCK